MTPLLVIAGLAAVIVIAALIWDNWKYRDVWRDD